MSLYKTVHMEIRFLGIFKTKHILVVVKLLIKLVFTKLQQVEAILF